MENSLTPDEDDFVNFTYDSIYNNNPLQIPNPNQPPSNPSELQIPKKNSLNSKKNVPDKSLEKFIDLLKCFICFTKVENPVMCPSCSGFACERCLKKWITEKKSECPVCRRDLNVNQIIKCRFLKDISNCLENLKMDQISNFSIYDKESEDLCSEHNLKMIYYCLTCSCVICSDCVMFTEKHKNHTFERVKVIYEKKIDCINKEMNELKMKIRDQETYLFELNKKADLLKKGKEERGKELVLLYRALNSKLENELSCKIQNINEERRRMEDELEFYETMHTDISTQLQNSTPAKTITKANEYIQMLIDLNTKKIKKSISNKIVQNFKNQISLKYTTGIFILKPYSLYKKTNEIVYSSPLESDGITWRIKVYPNGTGIYKGMYLSLFVELVKGWEDGGSFCYKVILIKPGKEEENIEREYVSDFENSICWGYNRFCKIEDIERLGFWDEENDQIILKYQVRAANHLQKIKDQENYICSLKKKLRKSEMKNKKFVEGRILESLEGHGKRERCYSTDGNFGDRDKGNIWKSVCHGKKFESFGKGIGENINIIKEDSETKVFLENLENDNDDKSNIIDKDEEEILIEE